MEQLQLFQSYLECMAATALQLLEFTDEEEGRRKDLLAAEPRACQRLFSETSGWPWAQQQQICRLPGIL